LGVLALPGVTDSLARLLGQSPAGSIPLWEILLSAGLALAFTGFAVVAPGRLPAPAWARSWLGLEAATHAVVVRPVLSLADALARFDDGALHGGAVRQVATGARRLGQLARRPQTGQAHQYYAQAAAVIAAAVVLLLVVS
jgi:NADH-quinone oxidoreductase subunit L